MSTIITEVYTAFKQAGVPEDATKSDVQDLKLELAKLDKELAVVKWVSFATFAIVAAPMIKSLLGL